MPKNAVFSAITTTFSALGINAVPAIGLFGLGWGWETTMLLYLLETLIGIPLVALRIRLLAPAQEEVIGATLPATVALSDRRRGTKVIRYAWPTTNGVKYERDGLLKSYLVVVVGFSLVVGVFMTTFLFLIQGAPVDGAALRSGLLGILAFQLLGFLSDWVWLRPLSLVRAEKLTEQSMGRAALLYLAVFMGICAAPFLTNGFLLPFIGLKTIVDVGQPIQTFLEYRKATF